MLNWRDLGGSRYTGCVQNIARITHWNFLDNLNLEEIYEGKYILVPAIGWYVSYITYFSSRDKTVGSNYETFENGMSVSSEQEAEYETMLQFSSTSAPLQHLAHFVRSLIGRFEQLEALQSACSKYSIQCLVLYGLGLPLPWQPRILLGTFYGHLLGTLNSALLSMTRGTTDWISWLRRRFCTEVGGQILNPITGNPYSHGYVKTKPMLYNSGYTSYVEGDTNANALEQAFNLRVCNNFCSWFHFTRHLQYKQWDPGVSAEVRKLSVAGHTTHQTSKSRKGTWCKMFNYKQARAEQAIAWGQAMFLEGGNVMTVHVAALDWVVIGCGPGGIGLVPMLQTIKESTTVEGRHRKSEDRNRN
jgi:hypothetical protein